MSRLCLGTVQFGMKYGINNTLGKPSLERSFEMLDAAFENGISVIDTASAYGDAEIILGEYFKQNPKRKNVSVISKLAPNSINDDEKDVAGKIEAACLESLKRIGIDQLDGYLLHTPEYVYNEKIVAGLVKLKEKGLVNNIGVSVYDIKEGDAAITTGVLDYVQLPYSVLDQRGTKTGFIKRAKKAGMTVFTRSAFLQGLYFMQRDRIPENLKMVCPYFDIIDNLLKKYNIGLTEALIRFVAEERDIDYLVFGVDTKNQLLEDIDIFDNKSVPLDFIDEIKRCIGDIDKSIIFPSLWSNGKKVEK